LGLFLAVIAALLIHLHAYIQLVDEVDRKSPLGKGPFSSLFGLGKQMSGG
jgi:hypothetical protein